MPSLGALKIIVGSVTACYVRYAVVRVVIGVVVSFLLYPLSVLSVISLLWAELPELKLEHMGAIRLTPMGSFFSWAEALRSQNVISFYCVHCSVSINPERLVQIRLQIGLNYFANTQATP